MLYQLSYTRIYLLTLSANIPNIRSDSRTYYAHFTYLATGQQISAIIPTAGGEGWIRTSVLVRGQIYSLLPLTTRPPLQTEEQKIMGVLVPSVNFYEFSANSGKAVLTPFSLP